MRNVIVQPLLLLCDVSPSYKFKVFKCNFNLSVMPDDETGSLTIVRDSLSLIRKTYPSLRLIFYSIATLMYFRKFFTGQISLSFDGIMIQFFGLSKVATFPSTCDIRMPSEPGISKHISAVTNPRSPPLLPE